VRFLTKDEKEQLEAKLDKKKKEQLSKNWDKLSITKPINVLGYNPFTVLHFPKMWLWVDSANRAQ
jgi:hypothetical protein